MHTGTQIKHKVAGNGPKLHKTTVTLPLVPCLFSGALGELKSKHFREKGVLQRLG